MSSTPVSASKHDVDPVSAAAERAPTGERESEEERAAVLAAMSEAKAGAEGVPHDELMRKLAARR